MGGTDTATAALLKRSTSLSDWASSSARVRFIDEFDALSRTGMESVLRWQREGVMAPRESVFYGLPNPFVLVTTRWEKRLPKAVQTRLSMIIPAAELDWSSIKKTSKSAPTARERRSAEVALSKRLKEFIRARENSRRRFPAADVTKEDQVLSSAFGTLALSERTALEFVFATRQKTWDDVAINLGVTPKRASEITSVAMQKLRRATHTGKHS